MTIYNPSDSGIKDYNVEGELYSIGAGKTVDLPSDAAEYLMKIYSFLQAAPEIVEDDTSPVATKPKKK